MSLGCEFSPRVFAAGKFPLPFFAEYLRCRLLRKTLLDTPVDLLVAAYTFIFPTLRGSPMCGGIGTPTVFDRLQNLFRYIEQRYGPLKNAQFGACSRHAVSVAASAFACPVGGGGGVHCASARTGRSSTVRRFMKALPTVEAMPDLLMRTRRQNETACCENRFRQTVPRRSTAW